MDNELNNDKKIKPVTLRSEMYNHNIEKIVRRDESKKDIIKWCFALGLGLIILLLIILIIIIG